MEFVVVAILCFFALIGILTAVSWVEMCVCASENRKNYLIIPVGAECRDIDLVITGAVDDFVSLKPGVKFLLQIIAAVIAAVWRCQVFLLRIARFIFGSPLFVV